jgi:L-lactate dehydrogenase complex protein LldG
MSSARARILGQIRSVMPEDNNRQQTVEQRIKQSPEHIRPLINEDHLTQFREKLELGGGDLTLVQDYQQASTTITAFINAESLPAKLRLAPALKHMSWDNKLEISFGKSAGDDLVSVTPAFCAIAESGSVVLLSSPESPTSLNFLPDVHFVIVEASQLLPHIEDVWTKLRKHKDVPRGVPRAINIITGPSKTADVEQTLQIGAHGPRQLKVIFIRPG